MGKAPKAILASLLILFGAVASESAMARRDHGHSHHGGNVRFGLYLGGPLYGPGYWVPPYYGYPYNPYVYPGPYAYPPVVVTPSQPPVYVEKESSDGYWYYCADSKAYYPYVKECPSDWQRVPAEPASR